MAESHKMVSRDSRTANPVSLSFLQSSHYYRFSSVAVDTEIANFHIISRYINYPWHCIVWTKCYHSPIILITEHVTMVSKKSITSIFQFFPCVQHSLSIQGTCGFHTELTLIFASCDDLIWDVICFEEWFSCLMIVDQS